MKLADRTLKRKLKLQHNRCYYCAEKLTDKIEIDHIIPFSKSKNGTNKNLCLSCKNCNRMKSDKSINQFRSLIGKKHPEKLIRGMFYFEFLNLVNE